HVPQHARRAQTAQRTAEGGEYVPHRAPRSAWHARQHAFHATHEFLHAAFRELLHHLLRLLELLEQTIDLLHRHPGADRNAALATGLEDLRLGALLRRHGIDDALDAANGLVLRSTLQLAGRGGELRRQLVDERTQPTHVPHLHDLRLEILQ